MTRIRWSAVAAGLPLIAALLQTPVVRAAELKHEVRKGEYASLIAKHYYGSVDEADLLLRYNGKPDTVIRPGETLRVPYAEVHRVRRGDTWSALAQEYLGRASAYPTIAALNGLDPRRPLQPGQTIAMPVIFEHALARGETLSVLAERFYGETESAPLIAAFNDIDDPRRLPVGATIRVPLVSPRLADGLSPDTPVPAKSEAADAGEAAPPPRPAAPETATSATETGAAVDDRARQATQGEQAVPASEFEGALDDARAFFEGAEFDAADERLSVIRAGVEERGSKAERAELWRLLAFVNVALDRVESACRAYGALADVDDGQPALDPDFVSPKIRDTLAACESRPGAQTEDAPPTRLP